MKATEGKIGRVFILRLEEDDQIPGCIEKFAQDNDIRTGYVNFIAGIRTGSITTNCRNISDPNAEAVINKINEPHTAAASGLIIRNEQDVPVMHITGFFGRNGHTLSGSLNNTAEINISGEVVLYEILDASCIRATQDLSGVELLQIGDEAHDVSTGGNVTAEHPGLNRIDLNDGFSHILHLFNSSVN